ncbi:MAG: GbsR/MarR family transcriptional regulator [Jiangellaceae bacterium]
MTVEAEAYDDDREQLLRFIERFAMVMAASGFPRMPARVFAYALADDADRYTARELAEGLRVSPAAISGALKYLVQLNMLSRRREPGARADHYVVNDDDLWAGVIGGELTSLKGWEEVAADGVAVLGTTRPGGQRMLEAQEFFAFLHGELIELSQRWSDRRRERRLGVRGNEVAQG